MTISIKSPTSTTGSIQKNGSDVITIDASDNVTVANDLTATSFTGDGSSLTGLPNSYAGTKNLIINGNMQIAQRATSVAGITTSGYYTVDRYQTAIAGSTGTWTNSQDTDVPSGQEFANSFKLECTTTKAILDATSVCFPRQMIEGFNVQQLGYGTANAKSVTLSFWVKSNKTGTYIAELFKDDDSRTISQAYTISVADTWEKKTITYVGDTTGTIPNDNSSGLRVQFMIAAGSNYSSGTLQTSWGNIVQANRAVGQVNLADTIGNYINITGVQLEVGEQASDFENLPYGTQLQLCQRYYQEYGGAYLIGGYQSGASEDYRRETFPVTMRATPTASSAGTWATTGTSNTKPNIAAGSNNGVTIYAVTTGGTWYMDANSVDDKLIFSAEL